MVRADTNVCRAPLYGRWTARGALEGGSGRPLDREIRGARPINFHGRGVNDGERGRDYDVAFGFQGVPITVIGPVFNQFLRDCDRWLPLQALPDLRRQV